MEVNRVEETYLFLLQELLLVVVFLIYQPPYSLLLHYPLHHRQSQRLADY